MNASECDQRHSGYVRWWQLASMFITLIGLTITVIIYQATAMANVDRTARDRDSAILETFSSMRSSLSRIEAKLETMK